MAHFIESGKRDERTQSCRWTIHKLTSNPRMLKNPRRHHGVADWRTPVSPNRNTRSTRQSAKIGADTGRCKPADHCTRSRDLSRSHLIDTGNHIKNIRQAVKNICRRIFNHLVVISGVRAAPTLDTCDDEPPVVLSEAYREPKLPDAYLLVRAVLERFAVVWRVAPRRGDDFIELVEYPVLLGGGQSIEVVFGR